MNLTDNEKKKLEKLSTDIAYANSRILTIAKKLSSVPLNIESGNDIDFGSFDEENKELTEWVKRRNKYRHAYAKVASRIWFEKAEVENYEKF